MPARVQADLTAAAAAAGFRPGTFDRFAATLPALLDTRARLTYEGFIAHGLGDLLDRSIVKRDGQWTVVTYLYPPSPTAVDGVRRAVAASGGHGAAVRAAGRQPRDGRALHAGVRQGHLGRIADRARAADRRVPPLGLHAAGPGPDRARR